MISRCCFWFMLVCFLTLAMVCCWFYCLGLCFFCTHIFSYFQVFFLVSSCFCFCSCFLLSFGSSFHVRIFPAVQIQFTFVLLFVFPCQFLISQIFILNPSLIMLFSPPASCQTAFLFWPIYSFVYIHPLSKFQEELLAVLFNGMNNENIIMNDRIGLASNADDETI